MDSITTNPLEVLRKNIRRHLRFGTTVFLTIILSVSVMGPAVGADNQIEELNLKVSILEKRIDDNLSTVKDVAVIAIQNSKKQTDYLSLGFIIIGIALSVLAFLGIKEYAKVAKLRDDINLMSKKMKDELFVTAYITRAMHRLCYSDTATDANIKQQNAYEGLRYLKLAEKRGYRNSVLYNWKAYALKRLSKFDDALEASTTAYELSEDDPYEKVRALFNSSCYLALLNRKVEAMSKLKEAIDQDPELKVVARNDEDLQKTDLSNEPEFQKLVAA